MSSSPTSPAAANGRGEAVPYARYGETVDDALKALNGLQGPLTRARLPALLPAGAARNALDCALWDLEAKRAGKRAWELAGLATPQPAMTCYTLSLGDPGQMAADAKAVPHLKLLKLKLGGAGDPERMAAVRAARPTRASSPTPTKPGPSSSWSRSSPPPPLPASS